MNKFHGLYSTIVKYLIYNKIHGSKTLHVNP